MMHRAWRQRPNEVTNIFNPPFCCVILTSAIIGYSSIEKQGMQFPLSFLVFPFILHKKTRELLPKTTRTSLAAWIEQNPTVKFHYYNDLISLKPFVEEAIIFGSHMGWLTFRDLLLATSIKSSRFSVITSDLGGEVRECVLRARVVGKWLAMSGSPETVMGLLGVKP